jgi:hypothetical protein
MLSHFNFVGVFWRNLETFQFWSGILNPFSRTNIPLSYLNSKFIGRKGEL